MTDCNDFGVTFSPQKLKRHMEFYLLIKQHYLKYNWQRHVIQSSYMKL